MPAAAGRQFILPPEVRELAGYPLYLLIAAWGLRGHRVLTTALVSRTFLITQSQARDALHYIRHEGRIRVISESVPVRIGTHPFCRGLRIHAVDLRDIPASAKRRPADVTVPRALTTRLPQQTVAQERQRRLRQWMVSRRAGEPVPSALLPAGEVSHAED